MRIETNPARGTTSGPVPYVGPLYTAHGREYAPATIEAAAPAPVARPLRPCC